MGSEGKRKGEIKGGDMSTITGNKNKDKDEEILRDEKVKEWEGGNKLKGRDRQGHTNKEYSITLTIKMNLKGRRIR